MKKISSVNIHNQNIRASPVTTSQFRIFVSPIRKLLKILAIFIEKISNILYCIVKYVYYKNRLMTYLCYQLYIININIFLYIYGQS